MALLRAFREDLRGEPGLQWRLKLNAVECQTMTRSDTQISLSKSQQDILALLEHRRKAENLFSIEELAEFLEVSVRSIRRMHAAGVAPPRLRRSRRLMYPKDGVLAWLPKHLSPHPDDANS